VPINPDDYGLRIFEPLPASHPAVAGTACLDSLACALCDASFKAGDVTTLVPLNDQPAESLTVEGVLCHWTCVEHAIELKEQHETSDIRPDLG
jgi:hypothetical protein